MKPTLALPLAAGAALAAAHAAPALAAIPVGRNIFRPIRRGSPAANTVALTFDDGPEAGACEQFLDLLRTAGVKATFFLVGEQVAANPETARQIAAEGHEIACHGYRHRNHLRLTPSATKKDLEQARDTIEDATEKHITLFRPPYGVFNSTSWSAAPRLGWKRILWTHWGKDWLANTTPNQIAHRALNKISAGDIILLHDAEKYSSPNSWKRTLQALPQILEGLQNRSLTPVPVTQLLT